MPGLSVRTSEGKVERIDTAAVDRLGEQLRGEVLLPGQAGYDGARAIWNGMIDRRPALIARCRGPADVLRSVAFARERGLLLSVKGGGHNIAGKAVCDGGLMIDLSPMTGVRVDPCARRAWVEPGCLLADVDHETQAFGLATPLGINSTTGLAGLVLGGGFGWLSRMFGLTADNLRSAQVVSAGSELVNASDGENPDLFWALRGGGGNFGVVTSFELELHPLGPEVVAGLMAYPFDDTTAERLAHYRDLAARVPEELTIWVVIRKAPPLPFIPARLHGREVLLVAVIYGGDVDEGEALADDVRAALGQPVGQHVIPHPYTAWQKTFDPLLGPGARNYWKSHNFTAITDAAITDIIDFGGRLPTDQTEIFFGQLGGAASRPAPDAIAYPHRDAAFVMNVHTRWESPADDRRAVGWARDFHAKMAEHATGGVYVNFIPEGDEARRAAFGPNYDRLVDVKTRWDPDNLFRMNQNIPPR